MAKNIWQTLNDLIPDNPIYDDGEVTVGDTGISWDTGIGDRNGVPLENAHWDDLDQWLPGGPKSDDNLYVLDDFRAESAIPWSWILGGGVVLVLFYAARR
jgi:hypothetical protein